MVICAITRRLGGSNEAIAGDESATVLSNGVQRGEQLRVGFREQRNYESAKKVIQRTSAIRIYSNVDSNARSCAFPSCSDACIQNNVTLCNE